MNRLALPLLPLTATTILAATTLVAQDTKSIDWLHAADGALPKRAANDTRPTILYFTFDT